jgi:hypothetical protein
VERNCCYQHDGDTGEVERQLEVDETFDVQEDVPAPLDARAHAQQLIVHQNDA